LATDAKPLEGKRVVVTRASEQSAGLARALEALGAEVIFLPAIQFAEPEDSAALDRAIASLERFDWLVFTSGNAVRFFARRAAALGASLSAPAARLGGRPKVAVVGEATAQAARAAGFSVEYVARRATASDLARELRDAVRRRRARLGRVLVPSSDRAADDFPRALAEAGAEVACPVAYRTLAAPADTAVLETLRRGEADVVSFASPSAFTGLASQLGEQALARCVLAAIGPTTARAIRDAGLPVAIEARTSTAAGLAEAIAAYFTASAVAPRAAGAADPEGAKRP
jgi:uroporphyrinogen-III synthase